MTLPKLIVQLDTHRIPEQRVVGGKALNLIKLNRYCFSVPPGFVITSQCYQNHLEEHGINKTIEKILAKINDVSLEETRRLLTQIQNSIVRPPLPENLINELKQSYNKLNRCTCCVAVRSSATAEDLKEQSFAGQYDTILGVKDFDSLVQAIKRCWASIWSLRAYSYRKKNKFNHLSVRMAVIIQNQIEADFSGVVFTTEPLSGYQDRMVIEYIKGLGDRLVSGYAAPLRLTMDKRACKISETDLLEVTDDKFSSRTIKKLAKQAVRIEKKFNCAQDIEWAVKNKKIYILQARPITATVRLLPIEDRQIWTDANAGEVLPDVVTPLTWSVTIPVVMAIFNSILKMIGAELKENIICGLIAGRAYFNLNALIGICRNIPGLRKIDLSKVFGGYQDDLGDLSDIKIPEEDIPVIRFKLSNAALTLPIKIMKLIALVSSNDQQSLNQARAETRRFEELDCRSLSDKELASTWKNVMDRMQDGINNTAYSGISLIFYANLDRICQNWLKSEPGMMANQLLAGMGDIDSAAPGLALCRLARTARDNQWLKDILLLGGNWEITRERIEKIESGSEFLRSWDEFMAQHGHHARSEIELSYPRWNEQPDYILNTIRNYISVDTKDDALKQYEQVTERRRSLTRQCRERLKNPLKRFIFSYYLAGAQRGSIFRENVKNLLVKALCVMRRMILEIAGRLKERNIIDDVDDIFFLSMDEIQKALIDGVAPAAKQLIIKRRAEYERNIKIRPPHWIKGRFDPENFKPIAVDKQVRTLKGLPVSPGLVRGKARVVPNTSSREQVLPGEILVAPFTDPGWAPYFMSAAAIVVDMGGLLSHGSIVAREYGIPAVVNVGPATQIIKTGQMIEVNGNVGTVRVL